jgi:hypothetical protein
MQPKQSQMLVSDDPSDNPLSIGKRLGLKEMKVVC